LKLPEHGFARPGHVDLAKGCFLAFKRVERECNGYHFVAESGGTVEEFTVCAAPLERSGSVLTFFLTEGAYTQELSTTLVGRQIPVIVVLRGNFNYLDSIKSYDLSNDAHTNCFVVMHDCLVVDGGVLLQGSSITIDNVVFALGCAFDNQSPTLHTQVSKLYELAQAPPNVVGRKRRGCSSMIGIGFTACGQSKGNVKPYKSHCKEGNLAEKRKLEGNISTFVERAGRGFFGPLLDVFPPLPGGNLPCISIGCDGDAAF